MSNMSIICSSSGETARKTPLGIEPIDVLKARLRSACLTVSLQVNGRLGACMHDTARKRGLAGRLPELKTVAVKTCERPARSTGTHQNSVAQALGRAARDDSTAKTRSFALVRAGAGKEQTRFRNEPVPQQKRGRLL